MIHTTGKAVRFALMGLLFSCLALPAGCQKREQPPDAQYFHEAGMKLFQEGFYELLPAGKFDAANEKFEQAENAFEQAIALNDKSAESHRHLGRVYALRKRYSDAADQFVRTISLEPENIDNYLILSSIYVRMERYNEAKRVLAHAKSLAEDPSIIEQIDTLINGIKAKAAKQPPAG